MKIMQIRSRDRIDFDKQNLRVGIDLGTSYTCIAYVDEYGKSAVVTNEDGERITPSVVYFESADHQVVGSSAKNSLVVAPDLTVELVKRHMGKDVSWQMHGEEFIPPQISSIILRKVIQGLEQSLDAKVKTAIITVPAYFGFAEKEATKQAGIMAGVDHVEIITEPAAAAIEYGAGSEGVETVAVFDLGGGTMDATIVKISPKEIRTIAVKGDDELGGKDWDNVIIDWMLNEWATSTGNPVPDLAGAEGPLREELAEASLKAEQLKKDLSRKNKATTRITINGEAHTLTLELEQFDSLTRHLLERALVKFDEALKAAEGKGVTDYDKILLVGGSTRMKQVETALSMYGKPITIAQPDEAVARGAALQAAFRARKIDPDPDPDGHGMALPGPDMVITHVLAKALGIVALNEAREEVVANLIPSQADVPTAAEQLFRTAEEGQTVVQLKVVETATEDITNPADAKVLGDTKQFLTFPNPLPKDSPVLVRFNLNDEGLLRVLAIDQTSGTEHDFEIDFGKGLLSRDQLEQARTTMLMTKTVE